MLVNAAGISLPASATMSELQRFRDTLAVDLSGVYATILAAYPLLKKAGGGSIINVTSINSVRGFPGNPGYVAAKAGLAGLTRALAADYARDRYSRQRARARLCRDRDDRHKFCRSCHA